MKAKPYLTEVEQLIPADERHGESDNLPVPASELEALLADLRRIKSEEPEPEPLPRRYKP
jgi:hypothetical protein